MSHWDIKGSESTGNGIQGLAGREISGRFNPVFYFWPRIQDSPVLWLYRCRSAGSLQCFHRHSEMHTSSSWHTLPWRSTITCMVVHNCNLPVCAERILSRRLSQLLLYFQHLRTVSAWHRGDQRSFISLLPPSGFQTSNSGHQPWQQCLFPLSHLSSSPYFHLRNLKKYYCVCVLCTHAIVHTMRSEDNSVDGFFFWIFLLVGFLNLFSFPPLWVLGFKHWPPGLCSSSYSQGVPLRLDTQWTWARPSGQQIPGTLLSLLPQHWDYTHVLPCLLFHGF